MRHIYLNEKKTFAGYLKSRLIGIRNVFANFTSVVMRRSFSP